ncbi:hypothetical protein [Paraglaciecola hydrolytica]|uniref:Uncharacterized protein n=1 Tax=Paraglaciecola hydrolytica TaxID=1799789 RepID=A0A136A162_9ALTE|nr:hypothetical protein [Paraglaciecola hydrolytica]KXI28972.1 hypothetical protein AX660_12410 [Paraglaciecola hydrolytica]
MDGNLTLSLLKRGDSLAVFQGELVITPKSGEPVPRDWLAANRNKIMSELAQQSNQSIFSYAYYQTGIYNNGRSPGVMIRFIDLLTGEDVYALFNAQLKRQRTTGNKKAGDPLPDGQFHMGDRSAFYMLWIKTALAIPRRFSEWHKSMSKLQHVYFIGERSSGDKLANKSIQPLSLAYKDIEQLLGGNLGTSQRQGSDNLVTRNGGKVWRQGLVASNGDKHVAVDHVDKGLDPDSKCVSKQVRVFESAGNLSACAANRVLSNQVMTCNVVSLPPIKKLPEEQSIDEWLQDYDSAS